MKRTATAEASFIYGFALVIGFLAFALMDGFQKAVSLTELMAVLLLLPTWLFNIAAIKVFKSASPFRRFFLNVTVITIITLAMLAFIASSSHIPSYKPFEGSFLMIDAIYFLSHLAGAILTQFVVFRKSRMISATSLGELPRPARSGAAAKSDKDKPAGKGKK